MPSHINTRFEEIEALWPGIQDYQALAEQYGIRDIFQDAGGKMLQLAIATGIDLSEERMGPDGFDRVGNIYEIKTVDVSKGNRGFSTSHHLSFDTIDRYRNRRWVFAIYDKITLMEVYRLEPEQMEPLYQQFARTLENVEYINNPKIPIGYVRQHGTAMYLKDVAPAWAKGQAA
jgi:hypothetical protein